MRINYNYLNYILIMLLILSIFTGCKKTETKESNKLSQETNQNQLYQEQAQIESETNEYIESQIIEPTDEVEIGEMIE